jgi:uncharacterized protein YbaR (Trm112 family)
VYLVLTDILSCPRCRPEQGLIVLSHRMVDRRILEGRLGCPICESQYPIHSGVADLRTGPAEAQPSETRAHTALELAALMGVAQGPGFALISGGTPALAAELAETVANLEWIALGGSMETQIERAGVNRLAVDSGNVPVRARSVRGAIVLDRGRSLRDIVRTLRPAARLVLAQPDDAMIAELSEVGVRMIARNDALLVAEKSS